MAVEAIQVAPVEAEEEVVEMIVVEVILVAMYL